MLALIIHLQQHGSLDDGGRLIPVFEEDNRYMLEANHRVWIVYRLLQERPQEQASL